jgi:septum formation protein
MLEAAGVPFEAVDAKVDEDGIKAALRRRGTPASEMALQLAEAKARTVEVRPNDLVLGCDQVLELDDGTTLDKPRDRAEAADQLCRLSGRAHRLHAAACVIEAGVVAWRHVESATLHVRPLGEAFLQDYLEREWEEVRWSVGGYHVEGRGVQLFERIEGSLFACPGAAVAAVAGFPARTWAVAQVSVAGRHHSFPERGGDQPKAGGGVSRPGSIL